MAGHLDRTFSALSDPIRRSILGRLAHGPATVGELAAPFDVSPPAISKHLRVLETAGLLSRRVEGRVHWCRIRPKPMKEAVSWIEKQRTVWEGLLDSLEDYLVELEPTKEGSNGNDSRS